MRENMSDKGILEKYIDLSNSYLHKKRKRKLRICYTNIRKHLV